MKSWWMSTFTFTPVRYREHYLCVLAELRRRGIRPEIAERPLPGVRWWLSQWLSACGWLRRSRLRYGVAFALGGFGIAWLSALLALLPLMALIALTGVFGRALALFYLLYAGFAFGVGVLAAWHAGVRGLAFPLAILGSGNALLIFVRSRLFEQLWQALLEPL
ncbi:MAG: hypothetical protein KatS3mg021_1746 [Fimbriimonadales bacterium]|nr:MAG: hypothetical protein KatS3mg021_1746 [Fimbriimonadales bacterium]